MAPPDKELSEIWQTLGRTAATAKSAHARVDRLEEGVARDFKEIASNITLVLNKVNDLKIEFAKEKGFKAGVLFIGGLVGAAIGALLPIVIPLLFR